MSPKRLMLINAILFVTIVAIAVMLITEQRQVPGEPDIDRIQRLVDRAIEMEDRREDEGGALLASLSRVDMFETIIPLPTPTPRPTPTPTPPPPIDEVIGHWRLSLAWKDQAQVEDTRTGEFISINVGAFTEVQYRARKVRIHLESVEKFKNAVFVMREDGEIQKKTMSMF